MRAAIAISTTRPIASAFTIQKAIAVLLWMYGGRSSRSDLVRQATWVIAVSQLLVLCVPIAFWIVKALAIGLVVLIAIAALIFLFTERP